MSLQTKRRNYEISFSDQQSRTDSTDKTLKASGFSYFWPLGNNHRLLAVRPIILFMSFCLTYQRDRASSFFPNKVENYKITPMMMIMYFFFLHFTINFSTIIFYTFNFKKCGKYLLQWRVDARTKKKTKKNIY